MVQAPIFHVNGDDPEACVRVARLAFEYRQTFHKDVVIDMVCYRRHGHNEGDDPSYTQPLMYKAIDERRSVRKLYTEALVKRGDITLEEAEQALDDFQSKLQVALDETRAARARAGQGRQAADAASACCRTSTTGVDRARRSTRIFDHAHRLPGGLHDPPEARPASSRPAPSCTTRAARSTGPPAEALAFGSLLLEGTAVRLAGQDTRRGTFSQRHAVLVDYETGKPWIPLDRPADGARRKFWIYDSLLSRVRRARLRVRLLASPTRTRWCCGRRSSATSSTAPRSSSTSTSSPPRTSGASTSGLVLLLPHGYEGQGPEHSLGPHRALPHAVRRGQHPGRATPPPRRSTSTCCAARCAATSASRWSCSRPSRCCG